MAMAITKNNFIIVYRLGDLDSTDFAAYYADKHDMDVTTDDPSSNSGSLSGVDWIVSGQTVGIQCSNVEILGSEDLFNTQVLNPIKYALENAPELTNRNIWGIVLGYNVPGGFIDGSDIISSTARISRIYQAYGKKGKNKLYNRSIYKRFDSDDADTALICSRLDAPNIQQVKEYIDNAESLNKQVFANGTFYIDPYSDRAGSLADDYEDVILDFKNNLLSDLNLDIWSTTFMDPYIDVAIPYVNQDSFVWSWFTDRAYNTFFQNSNAIRVFFYNADYDGAYEVRNESSHRWVYLSMSNEYVCSAGAMSNPTIEGFLNPNPFFRSLLRGGTIGESYLFSLPFFDWTVGLFGDPLTYCSFPSAEVKDEDIIEEHECWNKMSKSLAKATAHFHRKGEELNESLLKIVDLQSENYKAEVDLLYSANDLFVGNDTDIRKSQLKSLVDSLFDYPRKQYIYYGTPESPFDINSYLTQKGFKVSELLTEISSEAIIDPSNVLDEGWWQFEFLMQDDSVDFINYQFIL